MALSLKHAFTSAKADGTDTTKVQPSNWNAEHVLTLAADVLVGRTGTAGAAEEIPCTAQGRSILAAETLEALVAAGVPVATTGDMWFTLKTTAPTGWIKAGFGTIGDASSGAGIRANNDTYDLFVLLFENFNDTYCPIYTQNGGALSSRATYSSDADTAWAAHTVILLPLLPGRAVGVAGVGSGTTTRTLGQYLGAETHALSEAELAQHSHGVTDLGHTHGVSGGVYGGAATNSYTAGGTPSFPVGGTLISINSQVTGITINNTGSGNAHNNMQPTTFLNAMIKL